MTDEKLNKRIHEIIGLCLHEGDLLTCECNKCGKPFDVTKKVDFTTSWSAFGILWEWWQKHPRHGVFKENNAITHFLGSWYWYWGIISPRGLAEATVRFFEEG